MLELLLTKVSEDVIILIGLIYMGWEARSVRGVLRLLRQDVGRHASKIETITETKLPEIQTQVASTAVKLDSLGKFVDKEIERRKRWDQMAFGTQREGSEER